MSQVDCAARLEGERGVIRRDKHGIVYDGTIQQSHTVRQISMGKTYSKRESH